MRKIVCMGLMVLISTIGSASADPAIARGEAVIEQWCRTCHLRKHDKPDPDMAPAYEQIVLWPGRDRAYFERFMEEDHFPMPTFRLFDHEKKDVLAYLMHLQKQEMEQDK